MARVTTDWTEQHISVVGAMLTAAITGGLAALGEGPYAVWGIAALLLTIVGAMATDAFGGIVAGFVGAAVVIMARQVGGAWTPADFALALSLSWCLVVVGWATGIASVRMRPAIDVRAVADAEPAFGALGLLPAPLALARLDEEVTRARRHGRPLTVVLISVEATDPTLSGAARSALHRTVARLVESLVPDSAVPFALAPDEVGAILPGTDGQAAWGLLGPVVDAAGRASFTVREQDERRSLVDCAELHAGLVSLSEDSPDADRLLAVLQDTVRAGAPTDDTSVPTAVARSA